MLLCVVSLAFHAGTSAKRARWVKPEAKEHNTINVRQAAGESMRQGRSKPLLDVHKLLLRNPESLWFLGPAWVYDGQIMVDSG